MYDLIDMVIMLGITALLALPFVLIMWAIEAHADRKADRESRLDRRAAQRNLDEWLDDDRRRAYIESIR